VTELTHRQEQVMRFIREFARANGYPPTVREIGRELRLSSPSTVHVHLANLERLGLIRRDPTKPRALELVDAPKVPRPLPLVGQVAAGVLGGLIFIIGNPRKGILVPDELPYKEILDVAGAYLGSCPSVRTNWTPLESRSQLFGRWGKRSVDDGDLWQFASFAVEP